MTTTFDSEVLKAAIAAWYTQPSREAAKVPLLMPLLQTLDEVFTK